MNGLTNAREIRVRTPFGEPSDAIVLGTLEESALRFWRARPRASHPARRNQLPRKRLRDEAFGSGAHHLGERGRVAEEDLRPGEFLVPDQLFDRTKNRPSTFFGEGIVAHVALRIRLAPIVGRSSGCLRS